MLARQQYEHEIITIPLKKKDTMEITNMKLSVYNSKNIKMSLPMVNIRSITPHKKNKIRLQYYDPKKITDGSTIFRRKYTDFSIEKNEFSTNHLCRKIQKEYETPNTINTNMYGFLMMREHEHIISVYRNIKTNKGLGMVYVTNLGVALETDEGVVFDVPYQHITLITNHKKSLRIVWKEPWNSTSTFHFDFQMNKKLDSNTVRSLVQDAFLSYRQKVGHEFVQLNEKYGKASYDEMFNLIFTRNPEFQRYLGLHVKNTFGYISPSFDMYDSQNIISCKLAGFNVDLINYISEDEALQRKESLDFFTHIAAYNKKFDEIYAIQLELEGKCANKDEFVELQKSEKYQNILKAIYTLKANPDVPTLDKIDGFDEKNDKHNANALRATDARNLLIYKKWIQDVPLIDCDDEYDDKWMNYLLEKLNCEHGKVMTFGGTLTYEKLRDKMKTRDRNKVTLSSFVAPENIPTDDIYNNCWHDRINKIWYVYDDNLDERLQNEAISDPDQSQGMCGRRVWGFGEDQVVMFADRFPSIVLQGSVTDVDILTQVTVDRDTGDRIDYMERKMRNFILLIVREEDVTEELMEKFGSFTLQTEAMLYDIVSSGSARFMTPRMYRLWAKKYDFADLPINERVRRAEFVSQTGAWFDAKSKTSVNDVMLPATVMHTSIQ